MKVSFPELAALLNEDPILSYQLQYQLFHAPEGLKDITLWYRPGAVMTLGEELRLLGDQKILEEFLGDLTPGEEYFMAGFAADLLPLVERHFTNLDLSENCTAYTLAPGDFSGSRENLEGLGEEDARIVDENWDFQHEGSLEFLRHAILSYPSSAIRVEGRLAGWALCYDATDTMANLGALRVLEPYRNRGFGRKLAASLNAKVLAWGRTPLVHIYDSNLPSQNLSRSLGFKPHTAKMLWGLGQKK